MSSRSSRAAARNLRRKIQKYQVIATRKKLFNHSAKSAESMIQFLEKILVRRQTAARTAKALRG